MSAPEQLSLDPLTWVPGTVIVHRSGSHSVLLKRKSDNSGWWLRDGGGIADFVVKRGGDFVGLTPDVINAIFVVVNIEPAEDNQ